MSNSARKQTLAKNKIVAIPPHRITTGTVKFSDTDVVSFNPPTRTTPSALAGLLRSISTIGLQSHAHVIPDGERFVLVDGHRRRECLISLGKDSFPCLIHHLDKSFAFPLWCSLGTDVRKATSLEWMYIWYHRPANAEGHFPSVVIANINSCLRLFGGREGIGYMLDNSIPPTLGRLIQSVLTLFERFPSITRKPAPFQLLKWCAKHHTQNLLQFMVSGGSAITGKMAGKLAVRALRDLPMTIADLAPRSRVPGVGLV